VCKGLVRGTGRRVAAASNGGSGTLAERLTALPLSERRNLLLDMIRGDVATVLGHGAPGDIDPVVPFKDLGFDSLTAVELRNRLNAATGLTMSATAVFDHPNPAALTKHLLTEIGGDPTPAVPAGAALRAELDRLEAALAAAPDSEDEDLVSARLEELVARWKQRRVPAAAAAVGDRLETATTDEVLAFINDELGIR
ncbi:phosphopantetheine-binding protein, partial [Paractinoplanes durhamensis]